MRLIAATPSPGNLMDAFNANVASIEEQSIHFIDDAFQKHAERGGRRARGGPERAVGTCAPRPTSVTFTSYDSCPSTRSWLVSFSSLSCFEASGSRGSHERHFAKMASRHGGGAAIDATPCGLRPSDRFGKRAAQVIGRRLRPLRRGHGAVHEGALRCMGYLINIKRNR